jgi:hypothetical protein
MFTTKRTTRVERRRPLSVLSKSKKIRVDLLA